MKWTTEEKSFGRAILRILDGLLFISFLMVASAIIFFYILILYFLRKPFQKNIKTPNRRLLLTSGSHEANRARNIDRAYEGCLLNGYFEKVTFVYFLSERHKESRFSDSIDVVDYRATHPDVLKGLGLPYTAALLQVLLFLRFLSHLISQRKITHLEANDPYIQGLMVFIMSSLKGIPYFIRANCDYGHYYQHFGRLAFPVLKIRLIEKVIERLVFSCSDGVTALYGNYLRYALNNGAPEKRSIVATPVLDDTFFQNVPAVNFRFPFNIEEWDMLVYLGRVSWDKYVLDLVDVIDVIKDEFPSVKLVVLGGGELLDEMKSKIEARNLARHFHFAGVAPVDEIMAWCKCARAALATHGGFSLIELGGMGIPVVAYDFEWHSEIIRNEKTGLLVPFRDTKAMALAAKRLIQDPQLQAKLARRYKELVCRKYERNIALKSSRYYFELMDQWRMDSHLNVRYEHEKLWSVDQ